jgi:hypothetical protein
VDSNRVKGKKKETAGEMQQAWGEAKDKARDTWEVVKDEAEDVGDDAEHHWDKRGKQDEELVEKSGSR